MFGMGGSEILVILIVALLFLGPDKLPQAARQISKGIRDIKKQSRSLQQQIENDEQIGGALRDLKSALRGDEPAARSPAIHARVAAATESSAPTATATHEGGDTGLLAPAAPAPGGPMDSEDTSVDTEADRRSVIRPAPGTVAKGSDPDHG